MIKPEFVTFETSFGKVTFINIELDNKYPARFTKESLATAKIEMIDITGDKEIVLNNIPQELYLSRFKISL